MASAPDISPSVTSNSTCDGLLFTDSTVYAGSTVASADITQAIIQLDYSTLGTNITYSFGISANVILAVSISVGGATPVDISSYLGTTISTTFPFVNFNLSGDYGVTIPSVEDGVYYTTYTVTSASKESFTGTQEILVNCSTCCCITKMFQSINPDCECSDKTWYKSMRAFSYMKAAVFSTQVGNIDNAVAALNKASSICEGTGCGCND